jgi:anti-sigma factor RsiW
MTRDCHHWEPLLLDYLYDLLDAEEACALEAHLQTCPQCRQGLTQAKRQQKLIGAAARREFPRVRFEPPSEAVPSEAASGEKAIVVGLPRVRRSWDWKPWAVAAGILLAVSIVAPPAYFLLRERPEAGWPGDSARREFVPANLRPADQPGEQEGRVMPSGAAAQDAAPRQDSTFNAFALSGTAPVPPHEGYPFVVDLATDKTNYQPGETLHFRAVALDALSLRPVRAEPPLGISFAAYDPQGQTLTIPVVEAGHLALAEAGENLFNFAFGSWPIPPQAIPGRYSLHVREHRDRFASSTVFFDVGPTSAKPQTVVSAGDQQHVAEVKLYAEGGRLVAGVANRVYFRLDGTLGESSRTEVAWEGWTARLVDGQNRTVLGADQIIRPEQAALLAGRGRFSFVPQHGQRYRLEFEHPRWGRRVSGWLDPVASGVVVQVPDSVLEVGRAMPLRIISVGRDRRLRLVLECRSRMVGQQEISVQAGVETPVEFVPTPEVSGVCRLTVWEQVTAPTEWIPTAERLVFFRPKDSLRLEIAVEKAEQGRSATLRLRAVDEHDRPLPSVWTVSVRTRSKTEGQGEAGSGTVSLPVKMYLAPELVSEDIPLAEALWNRPEHGEESLDLLLGTQPVRFLGTSGASGDVMVALQDRAARSSREEMERQIRKAESQREQNAGKQASLPGGQGQPVGPLAPDLPKPPEEAKGLTKKEIPGAAGLVTAEKADGSPAPPAPGAAGFGQGGLPARPMLNEADKPLAGAAASSPGPVTRESALRRATAPSPQARQRPLGSSSGSTILWNPALVLPDGVGRVDLANIPSGVELEISVEAFTHDGRMASQTVRLPASPVPSPR